MEVCIFVVEFRGIVYLFGKGQNGKNKLCDGVVK